MAIRSKPQNPIEDSDFDDDGEGSTTEEYYYSDDSEEDPTFDIVEETRSSLSKLSIKKSKPRVSGKVVSDSKKELDFEEVKVPELNEADEKSFEKIEKIIQAGQLAKLKIDQCKVYLRKYGLRLTGTKRILIERIQEHLGIINGGGEEKYPVSSFVLNCKGDACTGDVVMFEQNVYEMYNIASRSASGPPCGTRIVAGRIVKESYGAAKQQHTFTVEVLWSNGTKPLLPLHPLLIKGRNLYRLKTMRQKWDDEEERRKVLLEKHSRGSLARSNRETRIQEKEMRKLYTGKRETKKMRNIDEGQKKQTQSNPTKSSFSQKLHSVESAVHQGQFYQFQQHKAAAQPNTIHIGIPKQNNHGLQSHHVGSYSSSNYPPRSPMRKDEPRHVHGNVQRQHPLANSNAPPQAHSPMQHFAQNDHHSYVQPYRNENAPPPMSMRILNSQPRSPSWGGSKPIRPHHQQQICRFYSQGRCYYGDKCKYLHDKRK